MYRTSRLIPPLRAASSNSASPMPSCKCGQPFATSWCMTSMGWFSPCAAFCLRRQPSATVYLPPHLNPNVQGKPSFFDAAGGYSRKMYTATIHRKPPLMTLTAILLITLSAFIHAFWNFFSKRQNPSTRFFPDRLGGIRNLDISHPGDLPPRAALFHYCRLDSDRRYRAYARRCIMSGYQAPTATAICRWLTRWRAPYRCCWWLLSAWHWAAAARSAAWHSSGSLRWPLAV